MFKLKLLDWVPHRDGALFGFARIELDRVLVIADVPVVASKNRGYWAALPGRLTLDEHGVAPHDPHDKTSAASQVFWCDRVTALWFSRTTIDAIREQFPGALP